jgi:hypothetical protein
LRTIQPESTFLYTTLRLFGAVVVDNLVYLPKNITKKGGTSLKTPMLVRIEKFFLAGWV